MADLGGGGSEPPLPVLLFFNHTRIYKGFRDFIERKEEEEFQSKMH